MKRLYFCIVTFLAILAINVQIFATDSIPKSEKSKTNTPDKRLGGSITDTSDFLDDLDSLDGSIIKQLIDKVTKMSREIKVFEYSNDAKSITTSLNEKLVNGKLICYQGDRLNLKGNTITIEFEDGTTQTMSLTPDDVSVESIKKEDIKDISDLSAVTKKAGQYNMTVSMAGFDIVYPILVNEVYLDSISIIKLPKQEYFLGDKLDLTGLVVQAIYNNGNRKTIETENLTVTGFDSKVVGNQIITVKFEDKTATYTVNVKEVQKPDAPEDIEIDRVFYTPKGGFTGEITVILTKPTESKLNVRDFSVHCPGLKGMTISSVSTTDNKTYLLTTPSYDDNRYILEIYLKDKTLESEFMVKSDCPVISYPYVTRTSSEKALLKFNADEAGTVFYIIKESNTKLRANTDIPTESELKRGKQAKISAGPNEISIDTLKANVAYELYYMTSKSSSNSVVYGPIDIGSEVEKTSTSKITIVKAESKKTNATQDIIITLSQPTNEPLTLDAFKIVCPAAATLRFDELENDKNKVYTLKMRGGFYDNNYEITINFPDGTYTKSSFRSKLGTPALNGFDIKRTSATTVKVIFESSMAGYIYYGFSEEVYVKPPYDEVLKNGIKQKINLGKNTLILENLPNDIERFFYWIPENSAGSKQNYVEGAGKFNKIPVNITEEIPEPESKIKIEEAVVAERYGVTGIKFTLSQDMGGLGLANCEITFEGNNGSLPLQYMSVERYEAYKSKVFFMISRGWPLEKGTYTLKIVFKDGGVAKKDVVLTERIN